MKFFAFLFAVILWLLPMQFASAAADSCLNDQEMMVAVLPRVEWRGFGHLKYGIPVDGDFLLTGMASSTRGFLRSGEQMSTFGIYIFDPKEYQKENLPRLDRLVLKSGLRPETFTRAYVTSSAEKFTMAGLEISCVRIDEDSPDYVKYRLDLIGQNKFGQALYFYDRASNEFGMLVVLAETRLPIDLSQYGIQKTF